MYYWYGWRVRVFDKENDIEITKKLLSSPHSTYDEAKNDREELKVAEDIEITDIFEADSRGLAEEKMEQEEFRKF